MKSADQHSFIASGTTRGAGHLVGKRLLPFRPFVQFQTAINAIDPFVIPTMAHPAQTPEQLAKALLRSLPGSSSSSFTIGPSAFARGSY
jgi:hypothetical protein